MIKLKQFRLFNKSSQRKEKKKEKKQDLEKIWIKYNSTQPIIKEKISNTASLLNLNSQFQNYFDPIVKRNNKKSLSECIKSINHEEKLILPVLNTQKRNINDKKMNNKKNCPEIIQTANSILIQDQSHSHSKKEKLNNFKLKKQKQLFEKHLFSYENEDPGKFPFQSFSRLIRTDKINLCENKKNMSKISENSLENDFHPVKSPQKYKYRDQGFYNPRKIIL